MRSRFKIGGAAIALGLLVGSFGGTFIGLNSAGADSIGSLTEGLVGLSTTTSVTDTPPVAIAGVESTTLTATVTLELVKGLLITPSGQVTFSETEYTPVPGGGYSESYYTPQNKTLSNCLLGLPSIGGLWQETCTASVKFVMTNGTCGPTEMSAGYSGVSDLLAGPSYSNRLDFLALPAGCPST